VVVNQVVRLLYLHQAAKDTPLDIFFRDSAQNQLLKTLFMPYIYCELKQTTK
jgi:hypothetical protein